jgi:hypothetical protein
MSPVGSVGCSITGGFGTLVAQATGMAITAMSRPVITTDEAKHAGDARDVLWDGLINPLSPHLSG